MVDPIDPSDPPTPRRRRVARVLAALICVVIPALSIVILAGVWVRSSWIDEKVTLGHELTTVDRLTTAGAQDHWKLETETAAGVLGVEMSKIRWSFPGLGPDQLAAFLDQKLTRDGWQFTHTNTSEAPSIPGHPYRPFDRDRQSIGWTQTLRWEVDPGTHHQPLAGGFLDIVSVELIAPCWVWMLPWLLPPIWWWWCPPGRVVPRLTVRRTLVATAITAVILSAPAALYRSASEDRALMALGDLQGHWDYGPDPAGSGRQVVTKVSILSFLGDPPEPYPGRLAAVLRSFPTLQILNFSGSQQVVSSDGFIPIVEDHPGLKELTVPSQADDRSMKAIGLCLNLRELSLDGTQITATGVAQIAHHPMLEELSLDYTQITKSSLDSLRGLPKLKRVHLRFKPTPILNGNGLQIGLQDNSVWVNKRGLKESGDYGQGPEIDDAIRRLAESLPSLKP